MCIINCSCSPSTLTSSMGQPSLMHIVCYAHINYLMSMWYQFKIKSNLISHCMTNQDCPYLTTWLNHLNFWSHEFILHSFYAWMLFIYTLSYYFYTVWVSQTFGAWMGSIPHVHVSRGRCIYTNSHDILQCILTKSCTQNVNWRFICTLLHDMVLKSNVTWDSLLSSYNEICILWLGECHTVLVPINLNAVAVWWPANMYCH